jgi:hypothetical protein
MAITATLHLTDSYGRTKSMRLETTQATVALAKAAIEDEGALADLLAAITDLELVSVSYSTKDTDAAFAGTGSSNADVGATFRLRKADGNLVAYKVPGFDVNLCNANGSIDPDADGVGEYFALFGSGGSFRVSDGEVVDAVVSGELDK